MFRKFSTNLANKASAQRNRYSTVADLPVQPTKVVVKKKGGVVEAIVGFIVGAASIGAMGYWQLVEQYQQQSRLIIGSVEAVEQHVAKVR